MINDWRSFSALKWQVGVGLIVLWNALMLVSIWLNGGMGKIHDWRAQAVVGLAALGAALFSGLVLWSASFRTLVTAEKRRDRYDPRAFALLLVVTGFLGSVALWFAFVKQL